MNVLLATSREVGGFSHDDMVLVDALQRRRVDVEAIVWEDAFSATRVADALVVRSTWNYHHAATEFLAWIHAHECLGRRIVNSPGLIAWNLQKSYLLALRERDIPIVPTVLCKTLADFQAFLAGSTWSDVVIKPALSASAYLAKRFLLPEFSSEPHVQTIFAQGRDVLVQPFVTEVLSDGERSYIVIDSEITHCVTRPAFTRGAAGGETRERAISTRSDEAALVLAVLAALPEVPLYARVDIVRYGGMPVVSEVELIEPCLYFRKNPAAADRFAAALIDAVRNDRGGIDRVAHGIAIR